MARVTVEDCLTIIPNRFELSLIAGYRAKCLMAGATSVIDNKKKEKYTVIALREIGDNLLNIETLKTDFKEEINSQTNLNKINNTKNVKPEENNKQKNSLAKTFDLEKELDDITKEEDKSFSEEDLKTED
jgi:DNA-directed RNA polymerase subunit omega